jgi:protein NirF
MPHLEGWARAGDLIFLPAVGRHEVLVLEAATWREVGRVKTHGQPVFAVARPDGRQVWVNFAHPKNDVVQVIDVESLEVIHELKPGKAVLHLEFSPRGEQLWLSVRDEDRIEAYDTRTFERLVQLPADKPSGIFMTARAHRIGL